MERSRRWRPLEVRRDRIEISKERNPCRASGECCHTIRQAISCASHSFLLPERTKSQNPKKHVEELILFLPGFSILNTVQGHIHTPNPAPRLARFYLHYRKWHTAHHERGLRM